METILGNLAIMVIYWGGQLVLALIVLWVVVRVARHAWGK